MYGNKKKSNQRNKQKFRKFVMVKVLFSKQNAGTCQQYYFVYPLLVNKTFDYQRIGQAIKIYLASLISQNIMNSVLSSKKLIQQESGPRQDQSPQEPLWLTWRAVESGSLLTKCPDCHPCGTYWLCHLKPPKLQFFCISFSISSQGRTE